MVKKKELMKFIDKVERKAVHSIEEKFEKLIDKEKDKILVKAGYMDKLKELQNDVNLLLDKHRKLIGIMKDDKTVDYAGEGHWNTLEREIRQFEGQQYITNILIKCKFDGGPVEKIRTKRDKEIQAVKDNYLKVKIVCQDMMNGAKVAEYLKGLGFDISDLEKDETKALMCKIDKTKLFVCGDNK